MIPQRFQEMPLQQGSGRSRAAAAGTVEACHGGKKTGNLGNPSPEPEKTRHPHSCSRPQKYETYQKEFVFYILFLLHLSSQRETAVFNSNIPYSAAVPSQRLPRR